LLEIKTKLLEDKKKGASSSFTVEEKLEMVKNAAVEYK
jgi:hypothetical protein